MAKAKTTKASTKSITTKKAVAQPQVAARIVSQDPGTADDAAHAASLTAVGTQHFTPPGLGKASVFASPDAQEMLGKWATKLTEDTEIDIPTFASQAAARAAAGARVLRLVESANREYGYFKSLGKTVAADEAQLKETLRGYASGTSVAKDFVGILSVASAMAGTPKRKSTLRKKAKTKSSPADGTGK